MAISIVQKTVVHSFGSTVTIPSTTLGNTLAIAIVSGGAGDTPMLSGVTNFLLGAKDYDNRTAVWYLENIPSGATSVVWPSTGYTMAIIYELTPCTFDVASTTSAPTDELYGYPISPGQSIAVSVFPFTSPNGPQGLTATQSNELMLGCMFAQSQCTGCGGGGFSPIGIISVDSGFTIDDSKTPAVGPGNTAAIISKSNCFSTETPKCFSAAGLTSCGAGTTCAGPLFPAYGNWSATLAAFLESTGGGGGGIVITGGGGGEFTQIHGFADLEDSIFSADNPALGDLIQVVAENSEFDWARIEFFQGHYSDGQNVPLPVSAIDGYKYSRSELIYLYHVNASTSPSSGWASGKDSLWFCNWFVDQDTGDVSCEEWYRRSGTHANAAATKDGQLWVYTVAQRERTGIILDDSPGYTSISGSDIATDKPFKESLAQALNNNSKFAAVNKEVFYCGEFTDGSIVPRGAGSALVSRADGYQYAYAECQFMFSWRWTTTGAAYVLPAESNGQLGPMQASVDSTGHVSITINMVDDAGNVIQPGGYGRIAVFAFCKRSATPATLATATSLAELSLDAFAPGIALRASTLQQVQNNLSEALLTPEFFGPTIYANGDTIPLPTSTVDGHVYTPSDLTYISAWADTTPASGTHVRVGVFYGGVVQSTGVVQINAWRLPPGAEFIDDDDTHLRLAVLTVARRKQANPPVITPTATAPSDVATNTIEALPDVDAYAITFDMGGGRTVTIGASESLLKHVIPSNLTSVSLPSGLTGSYAQTRTAPTSSFAITIKKNGSSIGSINFAASATTATFTFSSAQTLVPGDVLEFVAPATPDATMLGIYFTLSGIRNQ